MRELQYDDRHGGATIPLGKGHHSNRGQTSSRTLDSNESLRIKFGVPLMQILVLDDPVTFIGTPLYFISTMEPRFMVECTGFGCLCEFCGVDSFTNGRKVLLSDGIPLPPHWQSVFAA